MKKENGRTCCLLALLAIVLVPFEVLKGLVKAKS